MIFYGEILKDFQKNKVKYVLVGGIAFNLLGGERSTSDLDILVEMTDSNLAKIVKILRKHGYHIKQPVDPMSIANAKIRKNWIDNKHMKAFNFYKDDEFKEVDIIIDAPISFDEAREHGILISVGRLSLPVISIDHLIKMKKKANRPIDKLDIKDLRIIKKWRIK